MQDISINVIKIFSVTTATFLLAFLIAPIYINFLYKHKAWRKKARTKAIDGKEIPFFTKFHEKKETNVPRMGGVLIWSSVIIISLIFFLLSYTNIWWMEKINFLSRNQTWLPLFTLAFASIVGLGDDLMQVIEKGKYIGGGMSLKKRLLLVFLIALLGAWWFYYKLGFETINVPGVGDFFIGIWYIPLFIITMLAVYSGGVIDGIDGLSGGVFASIFTAFGVISFSRGQIDLATLCFSVTGAILAFLWFNIPPAKFYMSETGTMGLCCLLTVIAFLTDSLLVLPIIAFLLVLESASVIIQLLSKKFLKRKVFLAAPIHHHFEAKGWPAYKVTMRFWLIGVVFAIVGVTLRLIG